VWVNSDLTEGRGFQYPKAVCDSKTTARRLAKGKDVQGSNGGVVADIAFLNNGTWYAPTKIHRATPGDIKQDEKRRKMDDVILKAEAAGLTSEEISLLRGAECKK